MKDIIVKIAGTGSYLPERVVTNDEIAPGMGSSDEWIYSHTGIRSRHFAANDESSSSLGAKAAERAMEAAGAKPEEIAMIFCATSTPDYMNFPSNACLIQSKLGCKAAGAVDLSAACSGFVYALDAAKCYLKCHPGKKALVIGCEVLSRTVDWHERTVSMLFGDGAGAAVLETSSLRPMAKRAKERHSRAPMAMALNSFMSTAASERRSSRMPSRKLRNRARPRS